MKRSEINELICQALEFFNQHHFRLPPWAFWGVPEWLQQKDNCSEIFQNQLGWDLTDFGSGDFYSKGLLLFTLRNGLPGTDGKTLGIGKTYAEKIMMVREGQETPLHYHWSKMEDIINRGGGNLVVEMRGSGGAENTASSSVRVSVDGIERMVICDRPLILKPGESVTLPRKMYHRFYGELGKGTVLVGEVSMVNDDSNDNNFFYNEGRFPNIDEDEQPGHLLVSDYKKLIPSAEV